MLVNPYFIQLTFWLSNFLFCSQTNSIFFFFFFNQISQSFLSLFNHLRSHHIKLDSTLFLKQRHTCWSRHKNIFIYLLRTNQLLLLLILFRFIESTMKFDCLHAFFGNLQSLFFSLLKQLLYFLLFKLCLHQRSSFYFFKQRHARRVF